MKTIKITNEQAGQRLDKFLSDNMPDISRSQIQKMIKDGIIFVDDKIVSSHYKLKEGEKIKIGHKSKVTAVEPQLEEKPKKEKAPKIDIIEENEEYIIINKPAGLTVHGAEHIKEKTLVEYLLKKYPELEGVGEDPIRPGIVHRLDKEVSGLMVIPRNQKSFENIKKQFKDRTVNKQYTALVYGQTSKEEDEINFPIQRSSQGHKMAALPYTNKGEINPEGRNAITLFSVVKRYINYTLLKVKIKTGRTHQIRVHLAAYGQPIVGDNLYSTKRTREKNRKLNIGRVFLVADTLEFDNLAGERKKYSLALPKDLKKLLKEEIK